MTKRTERTALWNNEGSYFDTTNSIYYTKKELPVRVIHKSDYTDQLWMLGYEEKDMIYRRKKLLEPGNVAAIPKKNFYKCCILTESTYDHDFTADQFNWTCPISPMGRVKKHEDTQNTGLTYGSEKLHEYTSNHKKDHRRVMNYIKTNEEYKCFGSQKFRDVVQREKNPKRDQELISKKVDAGLTKAVAGL